MLAPFFAGLILGIGGTLAGAFLYVIAFGEPADNPRDEGANCEPVHVAFKRGKGRG